MVYITKRNHELAFGVMFGKILKETEKMLLVDLYDSMSNNWTGWIIKKCVTITN